MRPLYFYRSTGASAAAPAFNPGETVKIKQISFNLSAAGGETVTGTVDSLAGTAYDAILVAESMTGITSMIKTDFNYIMAAGDILNFAYTNAAVATWGLEIVFEKVGP